jgi:type IV pilus assembly protein PilM
MSSPKNIIVNCSATQVTAASVSSQLGSLQIEDLVIIDLDYDFSDDGGWIGAVGKALNELSGVHKLNGKASFIIPGNQLLTKTIRIPHVEEGKQAQIIAFEAQQNIPYPLHEVVWDTQVIGDDGVETEILFIACKSATIQAFSTAISRAGFTAESINAATILDYNALQFSSVGDDEDVLLINVGARSTNLLFKSADGFFVRNIALGGNTLTQGIADSLGKPFMQAEAVKLKFFGGSMDYSEDDSGSKLLTSSSDSFIRRMGQEITRSIVNYRRQKNGAAPKKILLCGRASLLPGFAEQLSVAQKVPVEIFDSLEGVSLSGSVSGDPHSLRMQLSEIVGEAVSSQVGNPAGVNLLPEEIQAEMRFAARKPLLMAAAICIGLAPWPAYLAFQQKAAGSAEQRVALQAQINPLQDRQYQILDNAETAETLSQNIQRVEGLVNSKSNWIKFLAELQSSLYGVKDIWLEELNVLREGAADGPTYEVAVTGQMLVRETANGDFTVDQEALSRRIKSLQSSFEGSEFVVTSKSPSIDWSKLRDGLNVLPFSINLVVDTAKPL